MALLERGELTARLTERQGWVFEPKSSIIDASSLDIMLPSDIREMIQLRLGRISPTTRELLVAGAVLEHDFTFEALCQVAHLTPQDGLFALDEAIEDLLLQESPQRGRRDKEAYRYARQALATRNPNEVIFAEIPRWPETAALVHAGDSELASKDLQLFHEHFGTLKRCRIVLARAYAVLARSRIESEQALVYVREAIEEAIEIGLPGECWQAEVALGRIYLVINEHEQAELAFTRAASAIRQLAGNITNDEMREHFLTQVRVKLMH